MLRTQAAFDEAGQSLLEMVILIGFALVIVTGLTIVTINGLKNSQFSQNQTQAAGLAQEAIDCVRSIRAKNRPVNFISVSDTYYWYDRESPGQSNQIWDRSLPGIYFSISTSGNSCNGLVQSGLSDNSDSSLSSGFNKTFVRKIYISDYYNNSNQKKVDVSVSWIDISGTHQSQITTLLSRY